MSKKKTVARFALSVDGKLLAGEGGGEPLRALAGEDLGDEFEVEFSPEILGGAKTPTLTGTPGDFLPKPVDFQMVSMKAGDGRCVVKYRRVSGRAC